MSTVNLKEFVKDADLREGESKRVSCPSCGGYNTFTMTRKEGRVLYNCYKNSCDAKGGYRPRMSLEAIQGMLDRNTPRNSHQETPLRLPDTLFPCLDRERCNDYLESMNVIDSINDGYTNVMYDIAEDRCVFMIYGDNKEVIGATGRALTKGVQPKWKRYDKRKDLMFFCGSKRGTAVLVEDCASACTVYASGYTGVALLGTSLNSEQIYQLRVFDKVIVALDADASQKAIKMQKMLAPHVTSEVLFLTDDLKYFTPECVRSLLTK